MTDNLTQLTQNALMGELEQLHKAVCEVVQPLSDMQLWSKPVEPGNSIGHLILHLTGNLNHFVGAQLGKTGYVREREREFTEEHRPDRQTLLRDFDSAVALFRQIVGKLTTEQLAAAHPEARFGSVVQALIHLVAHFAIHRGQISYLARLVK